MVDVKSLGDLIVPGQYSLHSKFSRVINFCKLEEERSPLLSVVTSEIGEGPFNIVVDKLPDIEKVSIEGTSLSFIRDDGTVLPMNKSVSTYDSTISFNYSLLSSSPFEKNLEVATNELLTFQETSPLVILLQKNGDLSDLSAFDQALMQRLQEGLNLLLTGHLEKAIPLFKGVGMGLTPSGDDFLSGLLIASKILSKSRQIEKNLDTITDKIFAMAEGGNRISNTELLASKCGRVSHVLNEFLQALSSQDANTVAQIKNSLKRISEVGHSSGIDTAVGLLIGLTRTEIWSSKE